MKKFTILMVLLFISMTCIMAQTIADYTYSTATDGSLVDMSSGTTDLLATGTYRDDNASAVVNLGFNFKLGTETYTQFSVNSNGQMQLGATAISGGQANPSSNLARLAPISNDNAIRATGKVHYKVTGSSPNQILTVEWVDLRVNYGSATETGTYCKMQAVLYETTNQVQYIYGTMYNMGTSAQSRGVYLSTSNTAGTVGNIITIITTPTWNVTATSVTNTSFAASSAMTNLNSAADGARRVFTFTPPVATNIPLAATLVSPVDAGWALLGETLKWAAGAGTAAWPSSYDVYFGTASTPPFVVNQVGLTYTPTLAAGMTYYWQIIPKNSVGDASGCPIWSFKTPTTTQVAESFESTTFPPIGWANGTSGTWSRSTSYYKNGTASAYKYGNSSTQYILSTPKVTITGSSTLSLWTYCSSVNGKLQIVYSPDRVTWTQIGSDISHAAVSTWYNTVAALDSLSGNSYYLGVRTGKQGASFYTDMYVGPEITPEAPGPVAQVLPADLATGVNEKPTFTWTAPTTGGIPTGYKVYCGPLADPTTLLSTVTGLTYTATTPLTYGASYYWKVVANNGNGDAVGSTVRSFTVRADPTIATFPHTQNFDDTWAGSPAAPTNWTVINANSDSYYWSQANTYITPTHSGTYAAHGMGNTNDYLITPPINLAADTRMKWWDKVESATKVNTYDVLVSITDTAIASFTDNLGTFNCANTAWTEHTLNLDAYTGRTVYIAFYQTASAATNYGFGIDDFLLEAIPANPTFTLTPNLSSWDFASTLINTAATKQFTITNAGGGTLNLSSVVASGTYYSISVAPDDMALTAGESTTFTVQYLPTVVTPVESPYAGSVTITDDLTPTTVISLSGSCFDPTITSFPTTYDFGTLSTDAFPPLNWTKVGGVLADPTVFSGTGSWIQDDWKNVSSSTDKAARMNIYSTGNGWLISPPIAVPAADYEVMFDVAYMDYANNLPPDTNGTDDQFAVLVGDGTSWAPANTLRLWDNASSPYVMNDIPPAGMTVSLPLGTAGTKYVAFYAGSTTANTDNDLMVDNITFRQTPVNPILSLSPDVTEWDFDQVVINTPATKQFTITNTGPGTLSITSIAAAGSYYSVSVDPSPVNLTNAQSASFTVQYLPTVEGADHTGTVTITDTRSTDTVIDLTGSCVDPTLYTADLPHVENFDTVTAPALPLGWSKKVTDTSTYGVVETVTSGYSTPNRIRIYNSSDSASDLILITPLIDPALNTLRVKFMAYGGTGYTLQVGTVDVPGQTATFTSLQTVNVSAAAWAQYSVNLSAYAGSSHYIAFRHGQGSTYQTIYLDDVVIEVPEAVAPEAATLVYPADGNVTLMNPILKFAPAVTGEPATGYKVYMNTTGNFLEGDVVYDGLNTTFATTTVIGQQYYWQVVPYNANGSTVGCPTWSFSTPGALQLAAGFEVTVPPAGWANGSSGSWSRSTSTPLFEGTASAYKYTSTSIVYVLSTPLLTIDGNSKIDFYTRASATSQVLQVVYSTDRLAWTQIDTDITYAATGIWYPISINLSAIAGNNYYIGFRTPTQTTGGSIYVDHVIGPNITPVVPDPVTQTAPAVDALNQSNYPTLTWTNPTTGGVPTGYKVYITDATSYAAQGSVFIAGDLVGTASGSPYTFSTPLTWEETYTWSIVPTNTAGDASPNTVRSFTVKADPTIYVTPTTPYLQDFAGTFAPTGWSRLNGLYGGTYSSGSQWVQDDWLNVTSPTNKSASINIYGSSRYGWLITPPINIPATGDYELMFDMGLVDYNATIAPVAGEQADDKLIVVMSDSPTMSSPTIIREWNNTTSLDVFDGIPATGASYTIPLTVSGTKYFAFYGESTVGGGDNDLMVDNVVFRETPEYPIYTIVPDLTATWDFGKTLIGGSAEKTFVISNTGPGTLTIASIATSDTYYSVEEIAPIDHSLTNGESTTFKVKYTPLLAGGPHTGTVTVSYTDAASTTDTIDFTGTANAPATLPLTEDWESGQGDWVFVNGTQTNAWYVGTADPYAGTSSAYVSNDAGVSNAYTTGTTSVAHVYRDIAFDDLCIDFPLTFQWKNVGESTYDRMRVYLVDTSVTPVAGTELLAANLVGLANYSVQSAWTAGSITLPGTISGTVKRLVFSWRNDGSGGTPPPINLDNISLTATPNVAGAPDAVTLNTPVSGATGLSSAGFDLTWTPAATGGTPTSYRVYMATDEGTIEDELTWVTTNTHFNPVTEGLVTFGYLDYYFWTVKAINGDGNAVVDPAWSFEIESDPNAPITVYPWTENFDAALTVPTAWVMSNEDGGGTSWAGSTTQKRSSPNSFKHGYSSATPDQDGWLITRPATIPATGDYLLSWWNYNAFPTYMIYNGVLVNTTNDPTDLNWVELWSQDAAAAAWSNATVPLNAYAGQTVYFAFNYQGFDADDWYIDDVSIYELTVDVIPPTITHLPVLNTPRDDIRYSVYAEIVDDATWNNPIGGAELYYSTDALNFTMVTMVFDTNGYYADIPAQILGTTVTYNIKAWDSELNEVTTDNFSFNVDNPTWVWYDQGGTTYLGYTTMDFGPTVLFTNPFYGTGIPMVLNTTDGSAYTALNANLHVYSYDGTNQIDLTGAIPVSFTAQGYDTFDLTSYNINITTPYFLVAYEDIPMGSYFLFDGTYDYGTTFVNDGGTLYTLSNPGAWAIGVNITNGLGSLDTPVVTITNGVTGPTLSWAAVTSANSYKVYGAADPYAAEISWTLLTTTSLLTYTYLGTEDMHFFKVVADSTVPSKNAAITRVNNLRNQASRTAKHAPKGRLNLKNRK
ncbi:MAG: choice-of-anchor J domain-containing protein [Candidatus Cloacimonetes bacterium]|nr:choice-of-anchor J domain-containing protein [Candidatus Cloacimonadota bacterium]